MSKCQISDEKQYILWAIHCWLKNTHFLARPFNTHKIRQANNSIMVHAGSRIRSVVDHLSLSESHVTCSPCLLCFVKSNFLTTFADCWLKGNIALWFWHKYEWILLTSFAHTWICLVILYPFSLFPKQGKYKPQTSQPYDL